jgi:hypothetical protein
MFHPVSWQRARKTHAFGIADNAIAEEMIYRLACKLTEMNPGWRAIKRARSVIKAKASCTAYICLAAAA